MKTMIVSWYDGYIKMWDAFDPRVKPWPKPSFGLGDLVFINEQSPRGRDSMSILHGKSLYRSNLYGEHGVIVDVVDSIIGCGTGRERRWWFRVLTSKGTYWFVGTHLVVSSEKTIQQFLEFKEQHPWRFESA